MFKPESMSKMTIMGPKTVMGDVIDKLYSLKIYHIVDHEKSEELDIGSPSPDSESVSDSLVKIRSLCSSLGINPEEERISRSRLEQEEAKLTRGRIKEAGRKAEKIMNDLSKKTENLREMREDLKQLEERAELFEILKLLKLEPEDLSGYESLSYTIGRISSEEGIRQIREELNNRNTGYKLRHAGKDNSTLIAVFFEKEKQKEVMDVLAGKGYSEIDASPAEGVKGSAAEHLKKLKEEQKKLRRRINEIEKHREKTRKEEKDYLVLHEKLLSMKAEKAEAPLRFGATEKSFTIRGWVPTKRMNNVIKQLNTTTKERIYITHEPVRNEEDIPIKLKNPNPVGFYEWFMDLYTLPKYKEIDPTFLMFLTFPLFYGFMLGDVGYGLVTLVLFLILRTRIKGDFGRLVNAMILASISTMVFGALFAEYFGLELYDPILINRHHDTQGLLTMAIAIGAAHINIGILIGFYNELMSHGFVKAVFEKISWLVLEAGAVLVALAYTDYISPKPLPWVGFVVIALSVVMIYKGEGAKGLVEIPTIFSHMLSYARLMAVGLASVTLAVVVNDLAGGLFAAGIAGAIGGAILLVIGHTINICLGLISPFLHSLRLHYVEFFTKFYEGGGMRYIPFGSDNR
ncbi:MAG: V-type ATP synthase subunit I [Candidatus Woesearchaeota archaeon]